MQAVAEFVPVDRGCRSFDLFMGPLPGGQSAGEKGASFFGKDEDAAAAVAWILRDLHEAAAFEGFEGSCQSGAIHGKQGSDRTHWRRFWSIEGHEE